MRNVKGLVAAVATSATVLGLLAAPSANAADAPKDHHGTRVTTVSGLKLTNEKLPAAAKRDARRSASDDLVVTRLRSVANDACVDADTGSLDQNGTSIALWDCNDDAVNQFFYLTVDADGYFHFQNAASGRYLEADLDTIGDNGTKVQLWDGNDWDNQKWIGYIDEQEETVVFENAASGRVLEADGDRLGELGTPVRLWDFSGADNQIWK